MTSTFPTSRNNKTYFRDGLREIQTKRDALLALELALKKRIEEFRELCLKEGELTGQLPIDYPLQQREPIPQVRRRALSSNGVRYKQTSSCSSTSSSSNGSSIYPIAPVRSSPLITQPQHHQQQATQPYYEETKPFQMSDFYKYSSEHKQKNSVEPIMVTKPNKTTRQLQEDVSRKNVHRFSSYDEQIQASVKLIEKSGQKLIEATAKAISGNPGLAEKLNIMLPKDQDDRY